MQLARLKRSFVPSGFTRSVGLLFFCVWLPGQGVLGQVDRLHCSLTTGYSAPAYFLRLSESQDPRNGPLLERYREIRQGGLGLSLSVLKPIKKKRHGVVLGLTSAVYSRLQVWEFEVSEEVAQQCGSTTGRAVNGDRYFFVGGHVEYRFTPRVLQRFPKTRDVLVGIAVRPMYQFGRREYGQSDVCFALADPQGFPWEEWRTLGMVPLRIELSQPLTRKGKDYPRILVGGEFAMHPVPTQYRAIAAWWYSLYLGMAF